MKSISLHNSFLKVSLITVLLIISQSLLGRNFYFSTSTGDDSRTSTQAQNPATPWKSISKLNSFFSSLTAGDSMLFKKGETFYGSIRISKSGTSALPIVIGAYGNGANPVITGFTNLKSWTAIGNGIYQSEVTTCKPTLNMVTVNGKNTPMGRFPNTGFLNFESHSGNTSITDNQLTGTPNWTNAEVVIRKNPFTLGRNVITNHNSNTIIYSGGGSTSVNDNFGYFIQNDPKTLDLLGEWYFDRTTKRLKVYFGAAPPSSYSIKASTLDTLVYSSFKSYVKITNLNFEGANAGTLYISGGQNISILSCGIDFSGNFGVFASGNSNFILEKCSINHSNHKGLDLSCTNASIRYNIIKNSGVIPGMAKESGGYNGLELEQNSDGTIVEFNELDSIGKHGIVLRGNNVTVKNNLINYFLLTVDDGGGIYTFGTYYSGRKIIGNIILNGIGETSGTSNPSNFQAKGIFLDEPCSKVEVKNNTVANCSLSGLHGNNIHDIVVTDNLFYNSKYQFYIQHSSTFPNDPTRNVSLHNNIFFSKASTQITLRMYSVSNDIALFGTADNNYYCRPIDDNYTILSQGGTTKNNHTLSGWQTFTGKDKLSKKSPKSITKESDLFFAYNASNVNKVIPLPAVYVDVKGTLYTSIILLPYTSTILIKSSDITGNLPPAILNQNFQLNENSSNGASVGNVVATDPNAGQILSYSIVSGNTNGAFSLNTSTGILTVANSSALNFETTPSFPLIVRAQDNGTGNLYSQATISVTILNVNENPVINNQSFSVLANSANTTVVGTVIATDPDAGQTRTFSIVSGNTNNAFLINSSTGVLTVANSSSLNFITNPSFSLVIKVQDDGTDILSSQAAITINLTYNTECSATGNITYQVWNNIGTGVTVSSLTSNVNYPDNPTSTKLITSMEGTSNLAEGFGARIAGYICAPATGSYTFWISSDDYGQLWLSTDDQPENKQMIAYHIGATGVRVWNRYTTQKSVSINLLQGQKYYIEALMKEGTGGDNLAVGWLKPGQTGTGPSEVIPGSVLAPLTTNRSPVCSATGNITYQVWNNIGTGVTVSSLTSNVNYPNNPTSTTLITSMEGISNLAEGFGARIAGYICAPATGSYTFWISSDDYGQLWLSSDDQPENKQMIAYHTGATGGRIWDKYTTQKSVSIYLLQGQKYYIEALMKEGTGGDNLAVGWSKPGQTGTAPSEVIPGSVLSPLGYKSKEVSIINSEVTQHEINLSVYPNPLSNEELNIKVENLSSEATLKIYSITGVECYMEVFKSSGTVHIDRSLFKSGMYIIRVFNNEFVKSTKLVVK